MTDQEQFFRVHAELSAVLDELDALGLHLAAADVSMALDRVQNVARERGIDLATSMPTGSVSRT